MITICAYCKKILSDHTPEQVDAAQPCQISHGMCQECSKKALAALEELDFGQEE